MANSNIVIEKYNSTYVLDSRRLAYELKDTNAGLKEVIFIITGCNMVAGNYFDDLIEVDKDHPFGESYYYLTEVQVIVLIMHYSYTFCSDNIFRLDVCPGLAELCQEKFKEARAMVPPAPIGYVPF
jgi:hypothetical protein